MARVAFNRAIAGMGTPHKQADDVTSAEAAAAIGEIDPNESVVVLTDEIQAVRMHQLAISLRPLPGSSGRPMLTASRWEVRKAIMSLCCTPPTMFEIEATDKSASIRVAFSVRAAAEDLSLKLRGTTVKIKGVKLHAFVREVSESSALSEGEDWADSLPGSKVLSVDGSGRESDGSAREAAFGRLEPGKRPDTIVLRGLPANWLGVGSRGKSAEGTDAPGLELMMSRLGPVRAVEVMPSAPRDRDLEPPTDGDGSSAAASASAGARHNNHHHTKNGKITAGAATSDFDVNALLSNMPKPRALAKGNKGGGGGGGGGRRVSAAGGSGSASGGGGGVGEVLSVALHVDAWVQFASLRGFRRALSALRGRTLKKAGAELLCEYRLGVDVTGFMSEERRRARVAARAKKAQEEERRKASIEKARGQLTLLREGLQSLRDAAEEDGRPAVEDAVKPTVQKVTEHVERAEALLGVRHDAFVDEKAATAAVSTARGEVAIARLSIRKARAAVDRAEEEERERIEREKDKGLRDAARVTLKELEESLSQGLALVSSEREHPGIKPQADTALELLDKLSDACSREGGGSEAFGAEGAGGGGGGGLLADARRATEKAITRACMLQRYLDASARLEALRVVVDEALLPPSPPLEAGGGNTTTTTTGGGSGGILSAQVDVATAFLSRELQGLSEGDLLLIWERAEGALGVADGMLETHRLVESGRHRLADAKAAVASGDPVLRTSEGIMRLIAAAAMSTARAQREGAAAAADVAPEALASAAERWRRAAVSADSDARAAAQEVERVAGELRDKRQREEEEKAWRKAEEERRLREAEAQRLERQVRAAEREASEKRQAEARIFAMELRREEMTAQVRNKGARKRLQEQFRAQRAASGASGARGGKKPSRGSEHAEPPPIADRWTLEEGLLIPAEGTDNINGSGAPATTSAPPPPPPPPAATATATAEPTSTDNGSRNGEANAPAAAERGDPASPAAAAVLPLGEDRWAMNDGAADLAERGVELEMGGAGLPAPLSPLFLLGAGAGGRGSRRRGRKRNRQEEWTEEAEAEWLELVSKRVRSSVVGGAEAGSWGAEASIDESGAAEGGGGGAGRSVNGVGSAAAATTEGKGGEIEAKLRQRLLAAMMGKSKAKAKLKVEQ